MENQSKYLIDFSNDVQSMGKVPPDFSQTYFVYTDAETDAARCPQVGVRRSGPVILQIGRQFKLLSEDVKRLVIYHEIGHCFYGKEHTTGYNIMNEQAVTFAQGLFYKDNRLVFVDQIVN